MLLEEIFWEMSIFLKDNVKTIEIKETTKSLQHRSNELLNVNVAIMICIVLGYNVVNLFAVFCFYVLHWKLNNSYWQELQQVNLGQRFRFHLCRLFWRTLQDFLDWIFLRLLPSWLKTLYSLSYRFCQYQFLKSNLLFHHVFLLNVGCLRQLWVHQ